MSYVVLARKWRPMSFRDLIGQEHVSRTLANAIEQQRVAHAFLFTGVRGVGKTTSARILAKALNCLSPTREGAEPCLACAACNEIADGTDVDVREIDGASYTGVDEIRKLQESLPYRPARDRYKIFIVDEVHMLSQNAWNALLKTLEEPPPHVKFILATTEVHKVPVTILSRVQRFDFKMIPGRLIAARIRHVLTHEQIAADDLAVSIVAREAAGSMRDALSLLDQVIAFSSDRLVGEEVARVLGVAGHAALLEIARAVLAGQAHTALAAIARLADQSCDLSVAARDLLAVFRDLVVARLCTEGDELLDLPDEERRAVREVAGAAEVDELVRLQQGFAKSFDDVAKAPDARAALEMLLVRLALRPPLVPIDTLLARLTELEGRLAGGRPPSGGPTRPGGPGAPPKAPQRPPASGAHAAAREEGAAQPSSRPPARDGAAGPPSSSPERAAVGHAAPKAASTEPSLASAPAPLPAARAAAASAAPAASPRPATNPIATAAPSASPRPAPSGAPVVSPAAPAPSARPAAARSAETSDVAGVARHNGHDIAGSPAAKSLAADRMLPPTSAPASESSLFDDWRRVIDAIDPSRPDLVAVLKHTVPVEVSPSALVLGYENGSVFEISLRSPACLEALRAAAQRAFGSDPKVSFETVAPGTPTLAEADKRLREQQKRAAVDRAEQHPSVREAAEILGARVKRIELGEG